jgi:fermentation-respiration switch protein FrsA (DUF1100 family)
VRQPIVKTPQEYGLDYEDVGFRSADGIDLKGWFIPGKRTVSGDGQDRVIILTHPMTFNRHGFLARNQGLLPLFKTDVDLLTTAAALNQAGYAVLMFDFRNHGESGSGMSGVGLNEYQDIVGAMDYVHNRPDLNSPQIGFVSFCMGANSTIVAMSKAKARFEKVRFLIAIQPVSAEVFVRCYMKDVYTPLSLYLIPIVNTLCQWRGGYALKEMSPLAYARDVEVPTLYVQAKADPWTELSDIESFYEAAAGPKELWLLEGRMRRFDTYNYVGRHPEKIIEFARQHCSGQAA